MLDPNFFNTILIFPILNILLLFHYAFSLIGLPGAFGFSIISLTVLIRLVLHPFFQRQIQTAKKMEEIKPKLDKLSKKHKKDKKRLQQKQLKLYKEAGVNPASGCIFLIIQIPVFFALYRVLSLFLLNNGMSSLVEQINKVVYFDFLKISSINPWFFGINLGIPPSQFQEHGLYYLLIPLLTAGLQYYQSVLTTRRTQVSDKKEDKKEKENAGDMQKMLATQMKFMFPLMIGWFSYSLPSGLSLYWNIFSIFSIFQYRQLGKGN